MTQTIKIEAATEVDSGGDDRGVVLPSHDPRAEFLETFRRGCRSCEPKRARQAVNISTFIGERLGIVKAATLLDERVPCDHIIIDDPIEQSVAKSAWRAGQAILARERTGKRTLPDWAWIPELPETAIADGWLRLSKTEAMVALIGLKYKSGENDGTPVAGGRSTPHGFVSDLSIRLYSSLVEHINDGLDRNNLEV